MHLAAQHGHGQVLEVMRSYQSLRISSKKLGVTALHVAAYFGQAGAYIFSGKVDHLEHVLYYLLILSKTGEKGSIFVNIQGGDRKFVCAFET